MKPSHLKVPAPCGADDIPADVCQAVGDVLTRVGDKWSVLVFHLLSRRSMRFGELRRSLNLISQKVLTTTLRGMERDGYVTRTVTPTIPPRVDYELTELGRDVLTPVTALAMWALAHRGEVEAARKAFDGRDG